MFCASGFQFQNFLASLSAQTRQVIQNVLSQRPSSNASALANAESRLHASAERQNDVLKDMDLQELLALARKVDDVELNRFLTSPLLSHYSDVHTSSESFFINKHGFSQSQVSAASFSPLQSAVSSLSHGQLTLLTRRLPQSLHMIQRGFKTLRSDKPRRIGFGGSRADSEEEKLSIFRSIRDSLTGSRNRKSEKLTQLVMLEKSPEAQEKLKVAFAEGYMANSRRFIDSMQVWGSWFRRILIWSIIIWIGLQVIQNYGIMGGNMKINVLKGEKYEVDPEDIKVSFSDVKGVDEAKEELQDIVEFLKDPDKFRQLGAKLPKGVLLVGPPGIGKTLLARAVAGEAGVPFFQASGSEFDEIFVGTGAKRVRQLFAAAKEKAPCVVFIDEIDTVGAKRTSSQIHPYANQTINQLLSEMDGFMQSEGVIVLGATNRRDNLDKALLRPGRFDVEVRVHLPDLNGRKEIFELYLSKIKYDRTSVDIEQLARGTTGCTGADLENIVNQAALKAAIDGERAVTMTHMEFARDKVFMGPARKSKIMDEETNRNTASHEAGHTIVAYYTKDATPLHKVTIVPRGMSLGHTSQVSDKEMYQQTKSQLLAMMDVAMGGRVAEEMTNGPDKVTTGASDDFKQATAVATAMVKRFGMSDKVGVRVFAEEEVDSGMSFLKVNELSPNTQELIDSEIKRLLQESYDRAKGILRSHQAEHRTLTQALLTVETLDANDVKAIMEGRKVSS